jgi:hypothetical protein
MKVSMHLEMYSITFPPLSIKAHATCFAWAFQILYLLSI